MGIGDAERGLAMRETSRKTAERLLTEGEKLVVAKDYTTAVAAFRDALLEQVRCCARTIHLHPSGATTFIMSDSPRVLCM